MEFVGLGLVLIVAALAAAVGYLWWRTPRYVAHRRAVVNLRTGTAVSGVIVRTRGGLYVLRDATVHAEHGEAAKVDGELVVEHAAVDYIQAL